MWSLLAVTACQKRAPVVAAPPARVLAPPAVTALEQADRAFVGGNYDDAGREYENYLRLSPSGGQRDQALFRLGLTYALRTTPGPDWNRAVALFRQLVDEYPDSALKPSANLILSLHSELDQSNTETRQRDQRIRQLSVELERLKKIDSERGKHP
jgi:TolA-binding protein